LKEAKRRLEEELFPRYQQVVAELQLTTDITPYAPSPPLRGRSSVHAGMAIKAKPDAADVHLDRLPDDVWPSFERFAANLPGLPSPETFRIPQYIRQPITVITGDD
jgi:hypothetical protein